MQGAPVVRDNQILKGSPADLPSLAPDDFTFEDFRWAVTTVMSRQNNGKCFSARSRILCVFLNLPFSHPPSHSSPPSHPQVPDAEGRGSLALVPFWDLINHFEGPMSTHYDLEARSLVSLAGQRFAKGEQVFMSYGSRPNTQLVLFQGFFFEGHKSGKGNLKEPSLSGCLWERWGRNCSGGSLPDCTGEAQSHSVRFPLLPLSFISLPLKIT